MMSLTPTDPKQFQQGWPRFTLSGGVAIEFEIKLAPRGDIPENTVIRAIVDDSQQYQADGRCWRAATSCGIVRAGQRLEKDHVLGWREME